MKQKVENEMKGKRGVRAVLLIIAGCFFLILSMLISITLGAAAIPLSTVVDALLHFDTDNLQHLMVVDLRLPRVISAALVGSALAVQVR